MPSTWAPNLRQRDLAAPGANKDDTNRTDPLCREPILDHAATRSINVAAAANISAKFYGRLFREAAGHTLEGPQVVARLV